MADAIEKVNEVQNEVMDEDINEVVNKEVTSESVDTVVDTTETITETMTEDTHEVTKDAVNDELHGMDIDEFFSDEEEFSNAPAPAPMPAPVPTAMATSAEWDFENPVFLYRMFYNKLFPWKAYFHWLNYDTTPTPSFVNREFSFTLPNDIYIRFKSFPNGEALKKEVERLQPIKMDIGAVYSVKPKDKKTVSEKAFKPLEKELVFDIDMTDYDEIRTCCTGGDICVLCWDFMTVAMKVIDTSLREDFGFEHIMWVYSGRRGVHCWVCDERARKLDNEGRKAIVSFLDIIKGGAHIARKVKLPTVLHPSLQRSVKIVEKYFTKIVLKNMGILDTSEEYKKLLEIIPEESLREKIETKWRDNKLNSTEKWELLVKEDGKIKRRFKDDVARDIMLQYCYPRLDVKVTTGINHLLKSPFCAHPKTLKVCVPIKIEDCDSFNPMTVPTLSTMRKEMLDYDKQNTDPDKKVPDYKKTSLRPYVEYFDKFVRTMLNETIKEKRDAAEKSMEF